MRILLGRVKGDKGDKGAQGPKGPQGERGPQGPPGEPGQTDIYTRAESDERYQLKGNSIDFQELARRIPSWQWKVTMPQTVNQTVTATVNGQTYTSDFYAQQGSVVTFSALGDVGYVAGIVSPTSATLTEDLTTVTVTAAKKDNVPSGSMEIKDRTLVTVPNLVTMLELNFNGENKYVKVRPRQLFLVNIFKAFVRNKSGQKVNGFDFNAIVNDPYSDVLSCSNIGFSKSSAVNPLRISWSGGINRKSPNVDISSWRDARQ